jgi:hypothetical protein
VLEVLYHADPEPENVQTLQELLLRQLSSSPLYEEILLRFAATVHKIVKLRYSELFATGLQSHNLQQYTDGKLLMEPFL